MEKNPCLPDYLIPSLITELSKYVLISKGFWKSFFNY